MSKNEYIQYFVEGECEGKFINAYKHGESAFLKPGKVEVLNPVNKYITEARARTIKQNTIVVFVYDIDKGNIEVLQSNIDMLKKHSLARIIHIQSVMNFEDEILRSTNLKKIDDMFSTTGVDNFKDTFIKHKDIVSKLKTVQFDDSLFWTTIYEKGQFKDLVTKTSLEFIKK